EPVLAAAAKANPQLAGPSVNLGIVYAHTNRRADAIGAFTKALQLNPKNAVAQNWVGLLARESNDLPRAEAAYKQPLALDSSYAPAALNLAILYDQYLKRPADALAAYKQYDSLNGKKDLKTTVWIAEMQSLVPASATPAPTTSAPATATTPAPSSAPAATK